MTGQNFPEIERIEPLLAAIAGRPEFIVARRPGFTSIDYTYAGSDTFGSIALDPPETHAVARLRRECRGLKFSEDGRLIARPFQKFFNIGEKPEVADNALPWSTPHIVLDKADGSMVHPLLVGDRLAWATRIGETSQSSIAATHAAASGLAYAELARDLLQDGVTPIFEYTGPDNRIVVAYAEARLVLTAARRNRSGAYLDDKELRSVAAGYRVPVIDAWGTDVGSVQEFLAHARGLDDVEGYVIRFADGTMVKIKADAYVLRHRALSDIGSEKFVLRLVIESAEDDVIPLLPVEIGETLRTFASEVRRALAASALSAQSFAETVRAELGDDRKGFAARVFAELPPYLRPAAFKAWEGGDPHAVLREIALRNTATFERIEETRALVGGAKWTVKTELEE